MSRDTKTLAIRLDPELHARLTMLAKLSAMSVTELIRVAIEAKLTDMASDPEIVDRAEDLRAAIARDATQQRDALDGLFSTDKAKQPASKTDAKVTRATK